MMLQQNKRLRWPADAKSISWYYTELWGSGNSEVMVHWSDWFRHRGRLPSLPLLLHVNASPHELGEKVRDCLGLLCTASSVIMFNIIYSYVCSPFQTETHSRQRMWQEMNGLLFCVHKKVIPWLDLSQIFFTSVGLSVAETVKNLKSNLSRYPSQKKVHFIFLSLDSWFERNSKILTKLGKRGL